MSLLTGLCEMICLWNRRLCLWLLNLFLRNLFLRHIRPHREGRWCYLNSAASSTGADNTPLVGGRHVQEFRVTIRVEEINIDAVDGISDPPSRGITVIIVLDFLGRSDRVYFLNVYMSPKSSRNFRYTICTEWNTQTQYFGLTLKPQICFILQISNTLLC